MSKAKKWFLAGSVSAFLSVISFIQTSQYVAEKTGSGLWIILGVVFAVAAAYSFVNVAKNAE